MSKTGKAVNWYIYMWNLNNNKREQITTQNHPDVRDLMFSKKRQAHMTVNALSCNVHLYILVYVNYASIFLKNSDVRKNQNTTSYRGSQWNSFIYKRVDF